MGKKAFLLGVNTEGLQFAESDVVSMGTVLSKHKYEVIKGSNNKAKLIEEFDKFIDSITQTDTLIFYYSGHAYCPNGDLVLVLESDLTKASSKIPLNNLSSG